jgi:hypothetical protein
MSDRAAVLQLYRSFLRVAAGMPTLHRQEFIRVRVREEFRKHAACSAQSEQLHLLELGYALLDQAEEQRKHLVQCKNENLLDFELLPKERVAR